MLVKAAPWPSYQSVEVEAEPSTIDGPPIAAPWEMFVSPTKTTRETPEEVTKPQRKPQGTSPWKNAFCRFFQVIWVNSWRPVIGDWRRPDLCLSSGDGMGFFCLTNWCFQVGAPVGKMVAEHQKDMTFFSTFFLRKNLFGEVIEMDAEWSVLSRNDLLLGLFHDNGPSPKFSKNWSNHPSIQRFIAPTAAPTRRKRSGVICCKSLRGSYGFIKIGDSETSRLLGVTCMEEVVAMPDTICFHTWWRKW